MNYTPQIKKALQFAAHKHDGLYRKDATPQLPALTHLVSVAWILSGATSEEDVIISKLAAFEREGPELLKRWSQPTERYLWYHGTVLEYVAKHMPNHSLTKRLAKLHARECAMLSGL